MHITVTMSGKVEVLSAARVRARLWAYKEHFAEVEGLVRLLAASGLDIDAALLTEVARLLEAHDADTWLVAVVLHQDAAAVEQLLEVQRTARVRRWSLEAVPATQEVRVHYALD